MASSTILIYYLEMNIHYLVQIYLMTNNNRKLIYNFIRKMCTHFFIHLLHEIVITNKQIVVRLLVLRNGARPTKVKSSNFCYMNNFNITNYSAVILHFNETKVWAYIIICHLWKSKTSSSPEGRKNWMTLTQTIVRVHTIIGVPHN